MTYANNQVYSQEVSSNWEILLSFLKNIVSPPAYAAINRTGDDDSGLNNSESMRDQINIYHKTTILQVAKDSRACVGAIIDANGDKKPNQLGKDIFMYQTY